MTLLPPENSPVQDETISADIAGFAGLLKQNTTTPFIGSDTSCGMEFELQVAVEGDAKRVDLPISIRCSSHYHNLEKRAARGDMSNHRASALREFLDTNSTGIWENSWVRLELERLSPLCREILDRDLLADKQDPGGPRRTDIHRFHVGEKNRTLRIPISYLLKLALADILGTSPALPAELHHTGRRLLDHFTSDNTSPEILSLTIPTAGEENIGRLAAAESCRTFLFIQLLVQYANTKFGLKDSGQRCIVYNAPHAPCRQKQLNEIVPDSYYRNLFMSPCLSGWDRGQEKHDYMALCHKTLSRSQLNTIGKLRDAGIITNNLVVLPNTSNTCLANNGTHVSLGSKMLSSLGADPESPFTPQVEKYYGDLVIKIVEHFLPLFVATYSAAPYKVDFADFHPEKMLGFLPHELDYTHLRMIWRRWKKKAAIRFAGHAVTPFGPRKLDTILATILRLKGDLIPDFRLIDYLVTLLSTETSPGLDGRPGNQERLKLDLTENGVFDHRMSIYLPYRLREFRRMSYSGFEGRIYSLFPSLLKDMQEAVNLQNLVTAQAFRYAVTGEITHNHIPDTPFIESERRQIFFACAVGLPTVFIHQNTGNAFMKKILRSIPDKRNSRRYKNYIRIRTGDYQQALINLLQKDAADLTEQQGQEDLIPGLQDRIRQGPGSAAIRIHCCPVKLF